MQTWTHALCFALQQLFIEWAELLYSFKSDKWTSSCSQIPNAVCVLPFESACCQCFCSDIPISGRGNNITITPPGEGLRCRANVGLLYWEEKRDAEWWIMILPKPVGCLSSGGGSLGNIGSLFLCVAVINFRWVFQKHSAVVSNRNVWILPWVLL